MITKNQSKYLEHSVAELERVDNGMKTVFMHTEKGGGIGVTVMGVLKENSRDNFLLPSNKE